MKQKNFYGSFLWTGVKGPSLLPEEKNLLQKEKISGVIIFKRNVHSLSQVRELCREIQSLSPPPLLMMDREGGSVDRLKHLPEFFNWPGPEELSRLCSLEEIEKTAFYMAREMKALGIAVNFAPVIDLPLALNPLFKGRLFGKNPEEIFQKARAYMSGIKKAGLSACAKHFPGHGGVREDSHITLPQDQRKLKALYEKDLRPFQKIIAQKIDLIMSAHILFPQVDPLRPATLSPVFLKQILREKMKFRGLILSDDLDMKALEKTGLSPCETVISFWRAGGDIGLKCEGESLGDLLEEIKQKISPLPQDSAGLPLKRARLRAFKKKYSGIKAASLSGLKKILTEPKAKKWQEELLKRKIKPPQALS